MPKLYWISNLRVLATIMVILIHTSGGGLFHFTDVPSEWWWASNIINGFGRFTVPVFVMISGALLLGRDIELYSFLQKRFLRVWIPFTVWAVIYVIYHNYFEDGTISFKQGFIEYLSGGGGRYGHLWFVYMILGLYLITPFVNHWLSKANEREVNFFLILCFIGCCIFPLIKKILAIEIKLDLQNFGGYIGYFVAGYVLKNRTLSINKWWYLLAFFVGYFITISGNYYLTKSLGKYDALFYDYLSPNSILMSLSIFMFFKEALNKEFLPALMNPLDACSFGIYLCHLQIINVLSRKFGINWIWHPPFTGIFVQAGITLAVAFVFIWLISKLPKSQWITG
jgi:surface polysaccharide O-acyltransferase-like enzyme